MQKETKDTVQVFALKNADSFVPVVRREGGEAVTFYGGDQAWYRTKVGRYSGCGAVAAADVFAYLSTQKPEWKNLFVNDSPEITVEIFLRHMDDVIKYVTPLHIPGTDIPTGGLTSLPRFTGNCEEFAASRGAELKGKYFSGSDINLEKASTIVAEQLSKDNPLALLIMQNRKLKRVKYIDAYGKLTVADMRYHWVVITSMKKQADRVKITVSSEGGKAELDFGDVWNGGDSVLGIHGIVYLSFE